MAVAEKKLVLTYVDSLRTDMLERTVAAGRAPTFAALLERGVLVPDCVSSFPSVTPVACSELVTGVAADRHWISGMNWYHRLERRYVEYGSSLEATRAFGVFRALYDLVFNMNLAHLNPDIETLILFGTSDHVLYPGYDRMAALVFPNHVGPFLLRDCGHFVPWEAPHALVSGLRAFCRDLLPAGRS